jgi:4'-phosphopantetheinyl transferase EntD
MRRVVAPIVGRGTVVVEAPIDARAGPLHPDEEAVLGRVVDKRRREFRLGRHCARLALQRLGVPAGPILAGAQREPLWPAGVVGSISHSGTWCAAAVATASTTSALGIDVESDEALADELVGMIASPHERRALPLGDTAWERVLFSAKESVYKAWFPLTRRWLDFDDVHVSLDPASGTFRAVFVGQPLRFTGRFLVDDGRIATAVEIGRR